MEYVTEKKLKTALYQQHIQHDAKIIDFFNWQMPLYYISQIKEHLAVREQAGIFDVSHMNTIDIKGDDALTFVDKITTNKLNKPEKAVYSLLLNDQAGIIDDIIIYPLHPQHITIIANAATKKVVDAWIQQQAANYKVTISHPQSSIIALQGPNSIAYLQSILTEHEYKQIQTAKPFNFFIFPNYIISLTGYTGEKGVEIISDSEQANIVWQKLIEQKVQPCGLGARDSLRVEAGFNLYGQDMDINSNPFNSNLEKFVDFNKDFIGKDMLTKIAKRNKEELCGIVTFSNSILRKGMAVEFEESEQDYKSIITSAAYSPNMKASLGFIRTLKHKKNTLGTVKIRNKIVKVHITTNRFLQNKKIIQNQDK